MKSRLNTDGNEARLKSPGGESRGGPGPCWGQLGAGRGVRMAWISFRHMDVYASQLPSTPLLSWCLGRPPRCSGSPDPLGTLAGKVRTREVKRRKGSEGEDGSKEELRGRSEHFLESRSLD